MKDKLPLIIVSIALFISLLSTCNSCNTSRKQDSANKRMDSLRTEIRNVNTNIEIEGYKISRRVVYDNNAIVRTTARPDDVINEYNKEIEKLEKQIK